MPFDSAPDTEVTARDRLIQLRDFLAELPDERFDIRYIFSRNGRDREKLREGDCGAAACICGWAAIKLGAPADAHPYTFAMDALGLNFIQADRLFSPDGFRSRNARRHYTVARAVKVLDHLIATGEVDWSVAFR